MRPTLKRSELDSLAKFYALDERGVESLFDLAAARPSRAEGLRFLGLALRIAGILSLASALVFFVAANWSELRVFGRFVLVEGVLLGCGVVALLKPPPAFAGRAALILAFISTGVLLALFGQTYQTGADVYELFLTWSLLGLPLVLLARWSLSSAAWVLVLNLALLLYCGWQPTGGLFWTLLGGRHLGGATLLLTAGGINLALWFLAEWRRNPAVPGWVGRLLVSAGVAYLAWAGFRGLFGDSLMYFRQGDALAFGIALLGLGAVAAFAWRQRSDIYPLAAVLGALIALGLGLLIKLLEDADEALFLLGALWLVASSTAGARWLLSLMRRWRAEQSA